MKPYVVCYGCCAQCSAQDTYRIILTVQVDIQIREYVRSTLTSRYVH